MAEKILNMSPASIITTYDRPVKAAGMAGVALLQAGDVTGLQSYHFLNEVEPDYDVDTYPYNFAERYFSNDDSPLFQVITCGKNTISAPTPTNVKAVPTNDGAIITADVPGSNGNPADNFVAALHKYYSAGAQFFVLPVTDDNHDIITAVSNFIEAQDNKELILDIPTDTNTPDLSFLSSIAGNKSTLVLSLVRYGDTSEDYQLASSFLAIYANSPVGKDPEFIHDLDGVTPQDQYEFSKELLDKYYTPYHVLTYAYRNGIPMFTSNKSQSGDQFSVMLIRDAISNEIVANVTNLFIQNDRIPYNQVGIDLFKGQIKLVLDSYVAKGLIDPDYTINTINSDDISDNKKASGILTGMGWKYKPVFSVDDVRFAQSIVLPTPQA